MSLEHGNYSDTFFRATLYYIWAYLKSPTWSHATLNPPLIEENKWDKSVFTLIFCQTSSLSTLKWFSSRLPITYIIFSFSISFWIPVILALLVKQHWTQVLTVSSVTKFLHLEFQVFLLPYLFFFLNFLY